MGIKVKLRDKQIDPELLDLLTSLSHHRQFCEPCEQATAHKRGIPCELGQDILRQIARHPDVSPVDNEIYGPR